jgi:hypothetical protein
MPASKVALSRALGAAFLNHQVAQLEKTVAEGSASGDWRDRRQKQIPASSPPRTNQRGMINLNNRSPSQQHQGKPNGKQQGIETRPAQPRNSDEEKRARRPSEVDADVIVVDASVLIHAIHQVKLWCRSDRKEKVVIPLEALNTLDLLKKGTNSLAQRARSASRILEAQVGVNNRIIVQSDDAYVLWGKIPFQANFSANSSPEWVRRTICCARYEMEQAGPGTKVVVAVSSSLNSLATGIKAEENRTTLSPVPLPAPHPHANKYEPRSTGALVAQWARSAGIEVVDIKPASQTAHDDEQDKSNGQRRSTGRKPHHTVPTGDSAMVKRPPAVLAMMEMVSQPNKAVRVLARGEKLDPDS